MDFQFLKKKTFKIVWAAPSNSQVLSSVAQTNLQ